jgi:hypothetical protein
LSVEKASTIVLPQCFSFWPTEQDQLLSKFQIKTAPTISIGKRLELYQNEVITFARSVRIPYNADLRMTNWKEQNSYLKHAILTLTLMHDRHLSTVLDARSPPTEAYHWYKATTTFSKQLSCPLQVEQQSALGVTATILSMLVFCHIEANTPEEAWPLRPPSSSDLDWLNMTNGMKELWKITQESQRDPSFSAMAAAHTSELLPGPAMRPNFEALPFEFTTLYALFEPPTKDTAPYRSCVSDFARVLEPNCPKIMIILSFWVYISNMHPDFKRLLQQKDPRALLLIACWYAELSQVKSWWLKRRVHLEGQAICLYLEGYYPHDINIQAALQLPKLTLFHRSSDDA